MVAVENQGNEEVNLQQLGRLFNLGVNGCQMADASMFEEKDFVMSVSVDQAKLRLTYGPQLHQHEVCIEGLQLENYGTRGGYLGVTARNGQGKNLKGLEVTSVKVSNLDPDALGPSASQ